MLSDGPDPCPPSLLASYVSLSLSISSSADTLTSYAEDRGPRQLQTAVFDLISSVTRWLEAIAAAANELKLNIRRIQRHRSLWLDKHIDECDAVEKLMLARARFLGSDGPDSLFEDVLLPDTTLLLSRDTLPRLGGYIAFAAVLPLPLNIIRIPDGLDVIRSVMDGPGVTFAAPEGPNTINLACLDVEGDTMRGLELGDFSLSFTPADGVVVTKQDFIDHVFQFEYTVPRTLDKVYIRIDVPVVLASVSTSVKVKPNHRVLLLPYYVLSSVFVYEQVAGTVRGNLLNKFIIRTASNFGIAVSADGLTFAVSNYQQKNIALYSTADGSFLRALGGGGDSIGDVRFRDPCKLCFAPNGNILVVEDHNKRIQEVTVTGRFIRFVGVGVFQSCPQGIAATSEYICGTDIRASNPDNTVCLFSQATGAHIRSFGPPDARLPISPRFGCVGCRFSPDGKYLYVCEDDNARVRVYDHTTGDLLRSIDSGVLSGVSDVDFAPNGDMIVSDWNSNPQRVSVFSAEGKHLRSFGSAGIDSPAGFQRPTALAVHHTTLFVLDMSSMCVRLFE